MNNKPVETFRSGSVKATIWSNTGDDNQVFYTATIARSYKDGNGEWKETQTYLAQHLADLQLVSGEAFKFIRMGLRPVLREQTSAENPSESQSSPQPNEPSADIADKTFAGKESQRRGSAKSR